MEVLFKAIDSHFSGLDTPQQLSKLRVLYFQRVPD